MLDIKFIRENPEIIKKAAKDKLFEIDVDRLLELDKILKEKIFELEDLRSKRNVYSSEIPKLSGDEKQEKVNLVRTLKDEISNIESFVSPLQEEFNDLMYRVPNPTLEEVPIGKDENDNVEIKTWGNIRKFEFTPKSHIDIGLDLDLMDFAHASKIAGSRTYYLKNDAVLLEMAVCRYTLEKLVSKGFTPMSVPLLVKDVAMSGTRIFSFGKRASICCN